MGKFPKKKDKYAELDQEWRNSLAGSDMDDVRINKEIRDTALYGVRMEELKSQDQDLAQKKEQAKVAGTIYRDAKKQVRLKTEFLRDILKNRARALPGD